MLACFALLQLDNHDDYAPLVEVYVDVPVAVCIKNTRGLGVGECVKVCV